MLESPYRRRRCNRKGCGPRSPNCWRLEGIAKRYRRRTGSAMGGNSATFHAPAFTLARMFNHLQKVHMQVPIHRDSKAWQVQVWVSFLAATFLCGVGLACLPGKDLDRAFMIMGYFFCLSAAFVLAKFVRDNEKSKAEGRAVDTPMFRFVVWGGFVLAMTLTGWGLARMEINETYKAFLGVSWLY